MPGLVDTHCSNHAGREREKHAAAMMKNTVVGKPGTTMPHRSDPDGDPSEAEPQPPQHASTHRRATLRAALSQPTLLEVEQGAVDLWAAAYPPSEPSRRSTRWHGMTIGMGFVAHAVPTARTARGRPVARARSE